MSERVPGDHPWAEYHRDFRTVIDGVRFILAIDPSTGGTVLRPWIAPPGVDPAVGEEAK